MKKVSIIIITRNRAKLITRAIESVLNQTYNNIELVIVDGASTDNTSGVVNSYKDNRIRYYRLAENLPVVDTINYAFEKSEGEYIAFLDDDDEYLPTKIEKQVNLLDRLDESYGLVYCWFKQFDVRSGKVFHEHHPRLRGDVHLESIAEPCVSGTPVIMLRRKVFSEFNGWRGDIGIISDWEFCARICQKYKVDYIPEYLVNCYEHHGEHQMTYEQSYYNDRYSRVVQFHLSFLEEFNDVFSNHPTLKENHLKALMIAYIRLSNRKKAWETYWELNRIRVSLLTTIIPLTYFITKK